MQVHEITPRLDLVELWSRQEQPHRAAGVHITDVIRYIDNTLYNVGKRPSRDEMSQVEIERLGRFGSVGYAFENIIRQALEPVWSVDKAQNPKRWVRPGELHKDGLYGNPDWLELEEGAVDEFKATYKSARREITSRAFWTYWPQIKAYVHMLSLDVAYLRTFFVCGDYRGSGPLIKMWRIKFHRQELEDNWEMLLANKEAMLEEQRGQRETKHYQAVPGSLARAGFGIRLYRS